MATVPQCLYAFDVLDAHFNNRQPIPLATFERVYSAHNNDTTSTANGTSSNGTSNTTCASQASSSLSAPLFITWNKTDSSGGHNLRGCIGTFEAQPLESGIPEYALIAALHDTRFNPISSRELPSLEAAISVLTDFEPASDALDWNIGEHGIRLSFTHQGHKMGATFLPYVAEEQGWTKEETIYALMRKAGWSGRREDWKKVKGMGVVRYKGTKAHVSYEDYKKYAALAREDGQK